MSSTRNSYGQPLDTAAEQGSPSLDVLIVGSGFGGTWTLYHLRKQGYTVRIFEAAPSTSGIWHWNCYPGARVDSEVPIYQFSLEELWRDWTWSEKYPGYAELRRYFDYVDQKLDIKKDISFNKRVIEAHFDVDSDRWRVRTEDGTQVNPRFLVLCTGFAAKAYVPSLKGLESFRGISSHTAKWPQEGIELKGKRVGVIGTGASGVQVIQEIAGDVEHLTVFQRTPNLALPMRQAKLDAETQNNAKASYPAIFQRLRETSVAFPYDAFPKKLCETTPSERLLHFEDQWARGGFRYLVHNYTDIMMDQAASDEVYSFWKTKVRERLNDPEIQEKLAPSIPPHAIGAKRASLEQTYYEVFNKPNVKLIDLNQCPITEVTPKGILTADGVEHELDVIVLATGFDSVTGGITQIDIRGIDGGSIKDKWTEGVATYLGMTTSGFPNMFFTYGPQGPTAFCNGPSCNEIQGEWIINCIKHMMNNGLTHIEAQREAEQEWRKKVLFFGSISLVMKTKSWYTGANIPGKAVEPYSYMGGVHTYTKEITEVAAKGYEGFDLSSSK